MHKRDCISRVIEIIGGIVIGAILTCFLVGPCDRISCPDISYLYNDKQQDSPIYQYTEGDSTVDISEVKMKILEAEDSVLESLLKLEKESNIVVNSIDIRRNVTSNSIYEVTFSIDINRNTDIEKQ